MAKPTLVTLPFIFFLIGYWPLQCIEVMAEGPSARLRRASLRQLIVERVPLILLSIASAAITIAAQKTSLASVQLFPLALRLESALIACVLCLKNATWPSSLALRSYRFCESRKTLVAAVLTSPVAPCSDHLQMPLLVERFLQWSSSPWSGCYGR